MLRTIAALVLDMAAKRLPHSGHPEQWELPELMDALQKTFQQTYDAQVGSASPTGIVNGFNGLQPLISEMIGLAIHCRDSLAIQFWKTDKNSGSTHTHTSTYYIYIHKYYIYIVFSYLCPS